LGIGDSGLGIGKCERLNGERLNDERLNGELLNDERLNGELLNDELYLLTFSNSFFVTITIPLALWV
jgi:hypothetical protein